MELVTEGNLCLYKREYLILFLSPSFPSSLCSHSPEVKLKYVRRQESVCRVLWPDVALDMGIFGKDMQTKIAIVLKLQDREVLLTKTGLG